MKLRVFNPAMAGTLAFLLTGVLAIGGEESVNDDEAAWETIALSTLILQEGCGEWVCEECEDPDGHRVDQAGSPWEANVFADHEEDCSSLGFGCDSHDWCGWIANEANGDLLSSPEFWVAMSEADGSTMGQFIANNAHVASYNHERRALQFTGCRDIVIASMPLSPHQVLSLGDN